MDSETAERVAVMFVAHQRALMISVKVLHDRGVLDAGVYIQELKDFCDRQPAVHEPKYGLIAAALFMGEEIARTPISLADVFEVAQ